MTRLAILPMAVSALVAGAAATAWADELDQIEGAWRVTRSASGEALEGFVLELDKEGDRLSGTARWPDGTRSQIAAASFKDGKLSFSIKPGDTIQQYSGELKGGRIAGKWAATIAVFDWEATRDQEAKRIRREFIGVSENRDFGEALAHALRQMDEEVRRLGKHPCSHVSWRVAEIGGESGTPADLKTMHVKVIAFFEARPAEDAGAVRELQGTWIFEHGALGEFDRLELGADGTFSFEHRDVALGTTTTFGEWSHSDRDVIVLRPARQELDGQIVRDFRTASESLRAVEKDGELVLEGKGRELRKSKRRQ